MIKEEFVTEIEETELDCIYPNNDENIDYLPSSYIPLAEVPCLNIDQAIELLKTMKEKSATHVYIGTHTDHRAYHFYGVKFTEI